MAPATLTSTNDANNHPDQVVSSDSYEVRATAVPRPAEIVTDCKNTPSLELVLTNHLDGTPSDTSIQTPYNGRSGLDVDLDGITGDCDHSFDY